MPKPDSSKMKLEGLQIQFNLLEALKTRHRLWSQDTPDSEIKNVHLDIIELIGQIRKKYAVLIEKHRNLGEPYVFHKDEPFAVITNGSQKERRGSGDQSGKANPQ